VGEVAGLSDLAAALYLGPRMAEVRSVEEKQDIVQQMAGFVVR
jgi:hypothetical protein